MKLLKKILLALLVVLILIQLIQPARNLSQQSLPTDLVRAYHVPDSVQEVLKRSCYDCHSNHTSYPWYSRVQPFGWLLANHIKNGKAELNFSEFGSYPARKQFNKLKGIENSIKDGSMPLWSYTLIHKDAKLSKEDKTLLIGWLEKTKDSLSKNW
jgi:hypothetical protein